MLYCNHRSVKMNKRIMCWLPNKKTNLATFHQSFCVHNRFDSSHSYSRYPRYCNFISYPQNNSTTKSGYVPLVFAQVVTLRLRAFPLCMQGNKVYPDENQEPHFAKCIIVRLAYFCILWKIEYCSINIDCYAGKCSHIIFHFQPPVRNILSLSVIIFVMG